MNKNPVSLQKSDSRAIQLQVWQVDRLTLPLHACLSCIHQTLARPYSHIHENPETQKCDTPASMHIWQLASNVDSKPCSTSAGIEGLATYHRVDGSSTAGKQTGRFPRVPLTSLTPTWFCDFDSGMEMFCPASQTAETCAACPKYRQHLPFGTHLISAYALTAPHLACICVARDSLRLGSNPIHRRLISVHILDGFT